MKLDRRDALRGVWVGVGAAIALSIVVGIIVVATVGRLPLVVQESIEGIAALIAVIVLTWMLFWMRRQGRAIKGELERGVDIALAGGSMLALAGLAFVSVAREGLETVLFLFAIGTSSGAGGPDARGRVRRLAVAVAIGYAIFAAGIRIDLRRFFTITGIVLIFVSAGLVAFAIHEFGEAGLIANSGAVFDLGPILPDTSPLGSVLAGLFGYRDRRRHSRSIGYLAYLIPVLFLFLRPARRPATGAVRRRGRPGDRPRRRRLWIDRGLDRARVARPGRDRGDRERLQVHAVDDQHEGRVGDLRRDQRRPDRARVRDLQGRDCRRRSRRARPGADPGVDGRRSNRASTPTSACWPRTTRSG